MTFIEQLKAHVGGLVRLKTDIYLYRARSRDGIEGRICLLLGAADALTVRDSNIGAVGATKKPTMRPAGSTAHALLLIDDQAKWIWTSIEDVEFIL
jgi:hypothetical protein